MTLLTLRIGLMCFAVVILFLADKEALAWLSGRKETLSPRRLRVYHYLMWASLLSLIATGVYMALPRYTYLLGQPLFIIKMLFVAVLFVNAFLLGRLMSMAVSRAYKTLSFSEKLPLYFSGAVSFVSWVSVIAVAFYMFGYIWLASF